MDKPTVFVFLVAIIFVVGGYLLSNYALIALGLSTGVLQAAISFNNDI